MRIQKTYTARVAGGELKVRVVESGLPLAFPGTIWQVQQYQVSLELRTNLDVKAQPTDYEGVHYAAMRIYAMQADYGILNTNLDLAIESFRLTPNGPNYVAMIDSVRQSYVLQEDTPDLDVGAIVLDIPVWDHQVYITQGIPMPAWAVAEAQTWQGGFKTYTVGSIINYYFPHIPRDNWHPWAAHLSGVVRPLRLPDLPLGIDRVQQLLRDIIPALQTIQLA